MELDFVQRLEGFDPQEQRWLVRHHDQLRIAAVYAHEPAWARGIERMLAPWIGFAHDAIAGLRAALWLDDKLVVIHDDDRGADVQEAADAIVDRRAREQWAITQIARIADALAAMRARDPELVHRRPNVHAMFVDLDGRARLRAPIPYLAREPRSGFLGRGYELTHPAWLAAEQVRGRAETAATDVFALAASLYRLVAGSHYLPRTVDDYTQLRQILDGPAPPAPATVSATLGGVILRGLARSIADRYPDPASFAAALRDASPDLDPEAGLSDVRTWRATARLRDGGFARPIAGDRCQKQWAELAPTAVPGVRHCATCRQEVVHATSLLQVASLLGRACVAYEPEPG